MWQGLTNSGHQSKPIHINNGWSDLYRNILEHMLKSSGTWARHRMDCVNITEAMQCASSMSTTELSGFR